MQSMAINYSTSELGERRADHADTVDHWERLNAAQKFAFYALVKLGYELLFVRNFCSTTCLAIVRLNEQIATIDVEGDIEFSPQVELRQD